MPLKECKEEFVSGKITKQEYIEKMHESHRLLFEYADFIKDKDIKTITITDGEVLLTTRDQGIQMVTNKRDQRSAPIEILNFDSYEKQELAFMSQMIGDNAHVLDIGANIGWYAIQFARMKSDVTVHAFEPLPTTFETLEANIEKNEIRNVVLHNQGFSKSEGTFPFYYYPEVSGNASMENLSKRKGVQEIPCHVMRLDDFMQGKSFSIDFIKCDVEGAELLVFQGGRETILKDKPIIFTEMLRKWAKNYDYHPNEILSFFKDLDYECYSMHKKTLKKVSSMDDTMETNFFLFHKEKHQSLIQKFLNVS